jgi:hypothetical protein
LATISLVDIHGEYVEGPIHCHVIHTDFKDLIGQPVKCYIVRHSLSCSVIICWPCSPSMTFCFSTVTALSCKPSSVTTSQGDLSRAERPYLICKCFTMPYTLPYNYWPIVKKTVMTSAGTVFFTIH